MVELFVNSGDPDQMPQNATSDLGLHCLPNTLLGVSRLQWVRSGRLPVSSHNIIVFSWRNKKNMSPQHLIWSYV